MPKGIGYKSTSTPKRKPSARKGETRDNRITNRLVRAGKLPKSQMETSKRVSRPTSAKLNAKRSVKVNEPKSMPARGRTVVSLPKGARASRRLTKKGAFKVPTLGTRARPNPARSSKRPPRIARVGGRKK